MLQNIKDTFVYRRLRSLWRYLRYSLRYGNLSRNINSARYWDAKLAQQGDYWRDENYHHLLDYFPQDEEFTLLDIGCALGDGTELLQRHFPKAEITGIDISQVGIETANKRESQVDYFVLDVLQDDIPNVYDYITIVETLEHFDDPFSVVDKCLNHVRQALIISVPYSPHARTGPISEVGEHRFFFDKTTFAAYNTIFTDITDYVEVTESKCIIYGIRPQ